MKVVSEMVGSELAIRAALEEIVKHIASTDLDAKLKAIERDGSGIADEDIKFGFTRTIKSIQRDQSQQ